MPPHHPPALPLTRWLMIIALTLLATWYFAPEIGTRIANANATPRPVVARGELGADEQITINIFEASKSSVVFISTRERVVDFWTRNVMSVPRGTGSGFIWDEN